MWYWLSSNKMTVGVMAKEGIIVISAPIVYKFRGQPLFNLVEWMRQQGDFHIRELK